MNKNYHILLIEDNPGDADLVKEYLSIDDKFIISHEERLSVALDFLGSNNVDVILLDLGLPDSKGLDTLITIKAHSKDIPVVVLTGNDDEAIGLKAVKKGAQDFVIKGVYAEKMLKRIISYAVERHQINLKLHESEQQFRTLAEFSPYAIMIYRGNKWLYANKMAEKITGYSTDEIMSLGVLYFVHSDNMELAKKNMEKRNNGENIPPYEFYIMTKSGNKRRVFLTGTRINFEGLPSSLVSVVDITEQHQLKESIERDDKLRSLGVLAAGIAHDFNNLLNGIFGNIELAQACLVGGKDASKYLERAISVFDRTKTLTQQLLTFSRGGAPVVNETDIADTVLNSAQTAVENSNCVIIYDVEENLNKCEHDKDQIRQVITCIIKNACESMDGKGKINIRLKNKEKNLIQIDISDSGKGIEQENINKIYDPFFSTKEVGLGLGLATSHSIIKKHGGTIEVESTVKDGSTFKIVLPSGISKDIDEEMNCKKLNDKKKVLIMDDEYFIQELLVSYLSEADALTFCASNGDEALDILKNEKNIAVAILDLTIPGGKGGREIIQNIRENFPEIKVFATSGYSSDPVISNPEEYGFTGSIPKPFKRDQLCNELKKYLCCNDFLT